MKEEKEKGRRNDKTNYKFVFNGEKNRIARPWLQFTYGWKKDTCVCVYIRMQFGPRTSVICYENKL